MLKVQRLSRISIFRPGIVPPAVQPPPLLQPIIDILQYREFWERVRDEIDHVVKALRLAGVSARVHYDPVADSGEALGRSLQNEKMDPVGGEALLRIDDRYGITAHPVGVFDAECDFAGIPSALPQPRHRHLRRIFRKLRSQSRPYSSSRSCSSTRLAAVCCIEYATSGLSGARRSTERGSWIFSAAEASGNGRVVCCECRLTVRRIKRAHDVPAETFKYRFTTITLVAQRQGRIGTAASRM